MSAWGEWAVAIFSAICCLNFWLITRELSRLRTRDGQLTHRIWHLETGKAEGQCCQIVRNGGSL